MISKPIEIKPHHREVGKYKFPDEPSKAKSYAEYMALTEQEAILKAQLDNILRLRRAKINELNLNKHSSNHFN